MTKDMPQKHKRESEEKWGNNTISIGFCIIPSLLLRAQQRLGLSPTHLAILLQLADYWWESSRKPYPSKRSLSERLGISERQIQRYIAELEKNGLVERIKRTSQTNGARLPNEYDLTGLVKRLADLAPEFIEVSNNAKEQRRQVSKPGGIKRKRESTNEQQ